MSKSYGRCLCVYVCLILLICTLCAQQAGNNAEALNNALAAYYQHLGQVAQQVVKTTSIESAYTAFYQNVQELPVFLRQHNAAGVDPEALLAARKQCKHKDRFAFFHPAAFYDNYQELLVVLNKEKMHALQKEIDEIKASLAPVVRQKEELDKQKARAEERLDKQKDDLKRLQDDLDNKERSIKEKRERIRSIDSSISRKRENIQQVRQRVRDLDNQIRLNERRLSQEQDPIKRRQIENLIASLERDRDAQQRIIDDEERDIDSLEREKTREDSAIDDLHQELLRMTPKLSPYKAEVKRLEQEKKTVEQEWQECVDKLKPLLDVRQKQDALLARLKKMEKSWSDLNFERRAKLILALYVLETFPPACYEIKTKKWFGVGGIVEVYFW